MTHHNKEVWDGTSPVFLNRVQHPASERLIRIADSHEIQCRVWGNQGMMHAVVVFTTTPG